MLGPRTWRPPNFVIELRLRKTCPRGHASLTPGRINHLGLSTYLPGTLPSMEYRALFYYNQFLDAAIRVRHIHDYHRGKRPCFTYPTYSDLGIRSFPLVDCLQDVSLVPVGGIPPKSDVPVLSPVSYPIIHSSSSGTGTACLGRCHGWQQLWVTRHMAEVRRRQDVCKQRARHPSPLGYVYSLVVNLTFLSLAWTSFNPATPRLNSL
ncbi:uncharacterized protein BO66DRAFT_114592 [Aspergillus aculeatinus CBS 121060]|uniref:Uncharacterized protein n=1 Tax=Aspergillus aculeatinus CBS 121060 TaxID=1448322 RepID=A0ACD1H6C8_9EURO|nr:hypothetical protein BO66DRAFT_114592 [Aspergillus aculeatinus CBS 121060]RAH69060.1 hypothetical protein BO66DRAFT_114592 [Aspergillus aculeatinus CBS 121060]